MSGCACDSSLEAMADGTWLAHAQAKDLPAPRGSGHGACRPESRKCRPRPAKSALLLCWATQPITLLRFSIAGDHPKPASVVSSLVMASRRARSSRRGSVEPCACVCLSVWLGVPVACSVRTRCMCRVALVRSHAPAGGSLSLRFCCAV